MKRRALIAGNWKMHTTIAKACELAREVMQSCTEYDDREVLLAPPFTALNEVSKVLKTSSILLGAQNVCWEPQGAFTGEISPAMVVDAGGSAAIIGHSERRQIFLEPDTLINKRLKGAVNAGLMTILCVGETLAERESGTTNTVIEQQIRHGLAGVLPQEFSKIVLAYEPVWAIGTGKTATKEQAQEVHAFIRTLIASIYEKDIASRLRIVYGGSVKPSNIDELMAQPDIDGALVGGAALDAESFGRIINFTIDKK